MMNDLGLEQRTGEKMRERESAVISKDPRSLRRSPFKEEIKKEAKTRSTSPQFPKVKSYASDDSNGSGALKLPLDKLRTGHKRGSSSHS